MMRRPPDVIASSCAATAVATRSIRLMRAELNFPVIIRVDFNGMCGVFGILNHRDASNLVYLGLYALQHRGQESAGIASVSTESVLSEANIGEACGSSGAGEQIIAPGTVQIHS